MPKVSKKFKKIVHGLKMLISLKDLGLTVEDLKAVAEVRGIKDYESMSENELLSDTIHQKKQKKQKKGKKQKQVFLKQK